MRLRAHQVPHRADPRLPVFKGRGGVVIGVDPPSNKALLDEPGNLFVEHLVSFDRNFKKLIGRSQFTLLMPAVVQGVTRPRGTLAGRQRLQGLQRLEFRHAELPQEEGPDVGGLRLLLGPRSSLPVADVVVQPQQHRLAFALR